MGTLHVGRGYYKRKNEIFFASWQITILKTNVFTAYLKNSVTRLVDPLRVMA